MLKDSFVYLLGAANVIFFRILSIMWFETRVLNICTVPKTLAASTVLFGL